MIITQAELTIEQFIPGILAGMTTVIGFFIVRYLARVDHDHTEVENLLKFVAVQEKENKALWRAIEELRQRK